LIEGDRCVGHGRDRKCPQGGEQGECREAHRQSVS
jgi:hypothetical protein